MTDAQKERGKIDRCRHHSDSNDIYLKAAMNE